MEIIKPKTTSQATAARIDLGIAGVAPRLKKKIQNEVGEYLIEQTELALSKAQSPVQGESFGTLTKKYAAKKKAEGLRPIANLDFNGDMIDALSFEPTENGIAFGVFGDEAPKADGHNKLSGKKNPFLTTQRRFLPDEGQHFKKPIEKEIERIVNENLLTQLKRADFAGVESTKEFYAIIKSILPDYSRAEMLRFIVGNEELHAMVKGLDLERFL